MNNNAYLPSNEPYAYRDDEIDLAELAESIWKTRWRVVAAVVLALLIYAAYLAVGVMTKDTPQTYRQLFTLNFDGLAEGQYPNGSQFVLSSILSQSVLTRVHERNDLEQYGLSVTDLRDSLYIEPYSAEFPATRARYEQRLADQDLSSSEIGALEDDMRRELSVTNAGSVRLSLQLAPDQALDTATIDLLLKDILRVWANRAISKHGVLELNQAMYSEAIFAESQYTRLDYPAALDLLEDNIELIREDITELRGRPNADNVRDPETGLRLIDLDKRLRDIRRYELADVINPVRELGLTRDRDGAMLYLERQLREVRLEQQFWEERAGLTRALIAGGDSAGQSPIEDGLARGESMNLTAQIDGSFLDQLMEIARQGDSEEFRQSLIRQTLEYEESALTQAQEAKRIERSLQVIRDSDEAVTVDLTEYRDLVETRLPNVLESLRTEVGALQRIADAISREASGSMSELVVPNGGSLEVVQASVLPQRAPLIGVAIAFLVGFATLVLSLLSDAIKRRRSKDEASQETAA